MRPFSEIIEDHYNEETEEIDLQAILDAAEEEMGVIPTLQGNDVLTLMDAHFTYALHFLGGLVLQTAEELDALPAGFDQSYSDFLKALEFDKFRRLYEYKRNLPSKLEIVSVD